VGAGTGSGQNDKTLRVAWGDHAGRVNKNRQGVGKKLWPRCAARTKIKGNSQPVQGGSTFFKGLKKS